MNTPAVTLDETTAAKLTAANGHPVPLCTPGGEVFGYYISPSRLAKMEEEHRAVYAELDRIWPPEKIEQIKERLKDKSRAKRTMEEVLRLVEGDSCSQ